MRVIWSMPTTGTTTLGCRHDTTAPAPARARAARVAQRDDLRLPLRQRLCHPEPNRSANQHFSEVVHESLARRSLLKAGAAGASALVVSSLLAEPAAATTPAARRPRRGPVGTVSFTPVPPNRMDRVTTPDGFRSDVLIRWGDPVTAYAPRFDVRRQTPEAAVTQFGYNWSSPTRADPRSGPRQ